MELFKKSVMVGISVTPEVGLEAAQIDFSTQTVLKYGVRPLEYDVNRKEIADMDVFKEALQDLLAELQIPKGAFIVLNIPAVVFKVHDYPASLDDTQISSAIEEELMEHPVFKNSDPCISAGELANTSIQFKKIAYTAAQRSMLVEVAMIVEELGYKLYAIDTSVSSTLNALILKERVDIEPGKNWVLLLVDGFSCRVLLMNGRNFVDSFEERVSIGEVLGDAENYATVVSAVQPILKNLPSQYLCIVSKTNIISAEILASKIQYSAPIIHQEANSYSHEAFLDVVPSVDESLASSVSLDIIGAALYKNFEIPGVAAFNLFNSSLGDVYTMSQPPEFMFGGRKYVLTPEFLITLFIGICIPVIGVIIAMVMFFNTSIATADNELTDLDNQIASITKVLEDNKDISTDLFDEGDEIKIGLEHNKGIYSYYTIVGTEIPKKLWLTYLKLGEKTTIEGQADNLESVYSFFRSIKDYNPSSAIKLQKLGLSTSSKFTEISANEDNNFDTDSVLTSLNADFYEFKISDAPEVVKPKAKKDGENGNSSDAPGNLPEGLETIKDAN